MTTWILIAIPAWMGLTVLFFSLCQAASRADEAADRYVASHPDAA